MKLKRNLITLMVVSLLVTSLTACSGKQIDTTEETENTSDVVETEKTTETTVVDEDVPHTSREDGHAEGHETVETTVETTAENNAPAYNPEDVDNNYVDANVESPVIPWNTQDAAYDYVYQICNDTGLANCVGLPVFWYPEGNKPEPIPYTEDYFTSRNQYTTDENYEDRFIWFSEDSICSNVIFTVPSEMCLIVGTDANTLPTLSSIYESTDGSQTLDEVIASNESIIVPTLVDRDDTAHIDAELAQTVPGAQITTYNPYGYLDYNVISEYDLFQGPGTYYIRAYVKSETGEWHVTSDTPRAIVVVDPVEAGLLTSYN